MLGRELGLWRFAVPENARLVPEEVQHRAHWGALQFGFEMGTGMRTYSPSALPHLALAAVVLVVPLPVAPAVAAGFAVGRFAMPVLSNAWSDDGAWTEVWAAAEPVVRPLLACRVRRRAGGRDGHGVGVTDAASGRCSSSTTRRAVSARESRAT